MVEDDGMGSYEDAVLEKEGNWSPRMVYRFVPMADIESFESNLETGNNLW